MTEAAPPRQPSAAQPLVIDTNVVLDLFVYQDPSTEALRAHLDQPHLQWLATAAMREELARVLGYPQVAKRLLVRELTADSVLHQFDSRVQPVPAAPKAPYTCKDPDDQPFIDLAVAHIAVLISKDAAVLCMAKRLAKLGVPVCRHWPAPNRPVTGANPVPAPSIAKAHTVLSSDVPT